MRQREGRKMYVRCNVRRNGSAAGALVVFLRAVYSCSLSIHLLLNRFNVFVANGHGDIEMWPIESRPCTLYDAHDTAIGLELEEAFILNVGRTGRDIRFNSSY